MNIMSNLSCCEIVENNEFWCDANLSKQYELGMSLLLVRFSICKYSKFLNGLNSCDTVPQKSLTSHVVFPPTMSCEVFDGNS